MAEGSGQSHNNIRAGLFVLLAAALGIAVFVILSGWDPFISRNEFRVSFTVEQGIDGLAEGSDVKVGGLLKGTVTGITPKYVKSGKDSQHLDSILVDIELDNDVTIYSNARVTRYMPLLGGGAWLNFDELGGRNAEHPSATEIPSGGTIAASTSGGMLATLLGPTDAEKTSDALQNIDDFTKFLTEIPKSWHENIVPMIENAQSIVADLRKDYTPWSKKVTTFLDNIDNASAKLDSALDDVPPLLATAQKDLDEVGVILGEVRTKTLVQVDEILQKGQQGADSLADALDRIDSELAMRMPDITSMLANLRQASAQLKLTTLEVRRSPWKLLYTPTTDVLAHENLYEAARSYVLATNELESAAGSFREVFELDPKLLERQPQLRKDVEKYVLDALERFKEAQKRLFSEIVDE